MPGLMGDLERMVLTAVLGKGNNAYGVEIRDCIEKDAGHKVSLPAIYTTLARLEKKGFLTSKEGEITPERGGKAKLYFTVTGSGQRALKSSYGMLRNLSNRLGLAWRLA